MRPGAGYRRGAAGTTISFRGGRARPGSPRAVALKVLQAALDAADPVTATRRHVQLEGSSLVLGDATVQLEDVARVLVVGAGKASGAMALALEDLLGDRIAGGLVVVPDGYRRDCRRVDIVEASHPIPDQRGTAATRRLLELADGAGERDLLLCVLSGGGSALLTRPAPGVTLADLGAVTGELLRCGATIDEINAVRKHLDEVKGGQLARRAWPARVATLVLSDVVGDRLDVVASGPTVADASTFGDACAVLDSYALWERVPAAVVARLRAGARGEVRETVKPADPCLAGTTARIVGSNATALAGAASRAAELGLTVEVWPEPLRGEAREVGARLAARAADLAAASPRPATPVCVLAGGETTVTVRGHGLGGRNQEAALAAAIALEGAQHALVGCLATDGSDGTTGAAGALVDSSVVPRARELGLDPRRSLRRNDSFRLLSATGNLLITGPTCTNVNDVALILVW